MIKGSSAGPNQKIWGVFKKKKMYILDNTVFTHSTLAETLIWLLKLILLSLWHTRPQGLHFFPLTFVFHQCVISASETPWWNKSSKSSQSNTLQREPPEKRSHRWRVMNFPDRGSAFDYYYPRCNSTATLINPTLPFPSSTRSLCYWTGHYVGTVYKRAVFSLYCQENTITARISA